MPYKLYALPVVAAVTASLFSCESERTQLSISTISQALDSCGNGSCDEGETPANCFDDCVTTPENNTCRSAIDISAGGSFLSHNINKNSPDHSYDLYYKFTLNTPKIATLNVPNERPEPALQTPQGFQLSLYKGESCNRLGDAMVSDSLYNGSAIQAILDAGTYYVQTSLYGGQAGYFYLNAQFEDYVPVCGDGYCVGESDDPAQPNFCGLDCWPNEEWGCGDYICRNYCGDGQCDDAEKLTSEGVFYVCPEDCWKPNDGECTAPNESPFNSYADCQGRCGDLICTPEIENTETCPQDCVISNDTCDSAIPLILRTAVDGSTISATVSDLGSQNAPDVWYKLTIEEEGLYAIDLQTTTVSSWEPWFQICPAQDCQSVQSWNCTYGQDHLAKQLAAGTYYLTVYPYPYGNHKTGTFSLQLTTYTYTPPSLSKGLAVIDDYAHLKLKLWGSDAGRDLKRDANLFYSYTDPDGDHSRIDEYTDDLEIAYDEDMFVVTGLVMNPVYLSLGQNLDAIQSLKAEIWIYDRDEQSTSITVDVTSPAEATDGEPYEPFFVKCGPHSTCDEGICVSQCPAIANCKAFHITCEEDEDGILTGSVCSECEDGYYGDTCTPCTAIANCAHLTCTSSENSSCSACDTGFELANNACNDCADGYYRKIAQETLTCVTDCGSGYTADETTRTCIEETSDGGSEDSGTSDGGSEDSGTSDGGPEDAGTNDGGGSSDASFSSDASEIQADADTDSGLEEENGGDSGCSNVPGSRSCGWLSLTMLPLIACRRRRK